MISNTLYTIVSRTEISVHSEQTLRKFMVDCPKNRVFHFHHDTKTGLPLLLIDKNDREYESSNCYNMVESIFPDLPEHNGGF